MKIFIHGVYLIAVVALFMLPVILNFFDHGIPMLFIPVEMSVFIFLAAVLFVAGIFHSKKLSRFFGRLLAVLYPLTVAIGSLPAPGGNFKNEFYDNTYISMFFMMFSVIYVMLSFLLLRKLENGKKA